MQCTLSTASIVSSTIGHNIQTVCSTAGLVCKPQKLVIETNICLDFFLLPILNAEHIVLYHNRACFSVHRYLSFSSMK